MSAFRSEPSERRRPVRGLMGILRRMISKDPFARVRKRLKRLERKLKAKLKETSKHPPSKTGRRVRVKKWTFPEPPPMNPFLREIFRDPLGASKRKPGHRKRAVKPAKSRPQK